MDLSFMQRLGCRAGMARQSGTNREQCSDPIQAACVAVDRGDVATTHAVQPWLVDPRTGQLRSEAHGRHAALPVRPAQRRDQGQRCSQLSGACRKGQSVTTLGRLRQCRQGESAGSMHISMRCQQPQSMLHVSLPHIGEERRGGGVTHQCWPGLPQAASKQSHGWMQLCPL